MIIPQPITIENVDIGDIGVPLFGFQQWVAGESPYGIYHGDHEVLFQYPFTGMLAVAPLLLLPLELILPVFMSFSAGLLAWGLIKDNQLWRLLLFTSFPFISAIHSGQFSLLVAAAICLPGLLPMSVVKPQTGIFLVPSGRWNKAAVLIAVLLFIISIALYPRWILDWIANGSLGDYDGWSPLLTLPGILMLLLIFLVRIKRARMLLSLALMPQRIFYDQVSIFLLPKSFLEMSILVIISWMIAILSKEIGWIDYYGQQDARAQLLTVAGLYLPMLYSVLRESWKDDRNILLKFLKTKSFGPDLIK